MPGFQDITGHEMIKQHFCKAIVTGNVSHAYILAGEAGMGKKSLANAFVLSLLCESGDGSPCLECHACKQVLSKNHPDVIYVTHEKPASISVDEIRGQINDTIMIKPYSSRYKLYLVDEAEKMTVQAQNALLKTIEEPPGYAVILLLTDNPESFLSTILSRCVQLKLRPLTDSSIKKYLEEHFQVVESKADVYAAIARGNLGKAIDLAASEEFQLFYREVLDLLIHVKKLDISQLLERIKILRDDTIDIYECLDFMQLWYRDVLMFKVTNDANLSIFKDEFNHIRQISKMSGYDSLGLILNSIDKARRRINANVNMELAIELMLLDMKED